MGSDEGSDVGSDVGSTAEGAGVGNDVGICTGPPWVVIFKPKYSLKPSDPCPNTEVQNGSRDEQ